MLNLSALEIRVIGCLIEKAVTTPDQYPLSLNSLTLACNQKSNREPVMELLEAQVQTTLDALAKKHLVSQVSAMGSRVVKYQHRFCNTQFSELQLNPQELAIICVLFLRGWQTPGELRTRTQRLCEFDEVLQVEKCLHHLMSRSEPLLAKLPREPGKRESRYAHLFSGEIDEAAYNETLQERPAKSTATPTNSALEERVEYLELALEEVQLELASIKTQLAQLLG